MIVAQPVRGGQVVYARGADLVVVSSVNPGAQVIADGSIHVWGPLRGGALAGALLLAVGVGIGTLVAQRFSRFMCPAG